MKALKRLRLEVEKVKIELSRDNENEASFFLDALYNGKDFQLTIKRTTYEELCKDKWKICIDKIEEALKLAKLEKGDIDEIILVGGSVRTPKIQEMVKNYFGKEPLQNVNVEEVVAVGATLAPTLDLKIHDIITKTIGIEIANGKMSPIFEVGTVLPFKDKPLKYAKDFGVGGKNPKNKQVIKIYEGNDEIAKNNTFLGKFTLELDEKQKEKS